MIFFIIIQLILVAIGATSAMTWFSYAMSENFRELYKEPVLLSFALKKTNITLSEKSRKTWGWLIHYIIGFLFVMGYHMVWVKNIFATQCAYIRRYQWCNWNTQLDRYI